MTPRKNALEWGVFAGSLALILGAVAALVTAHVTSSGRPPMLRVHAGESRTVPGGFAVPVEVANEGDRTAEEVRIEVTLTAGGSDVTRELTIALVPRRSRRSGWVTFETDPARGALRAHAVSYRNP